MLQSVLFKYCVKSPISRIRLNVAKVSFKRFLKLVRLERKRRLCISRDAHMTVRNIRAYKICLMLYSSTVADHLSIWVMLPRISYWPWYWVCNTSCTKYLRYWSTKRSCLEGIVRDSCCSFSENFDIHMYLIQKLLSYTYVEFVSIIYLTHTRITF